MKDVSIIIVSWNTQNLLRNCLQSVYEQTRKYSFDIWVVDNNSPDQSAQMVSNEFPEVHLIANADNKGFAPANNQAIERATGRYVLLLNPDTVILDGAIDRMLDYAERHKEEKLGILTCKLLNDDLTLQKSVNDFYTFFNSFVENRFLSGICEKLGIGSQRFTSYWDHSTDKEIDWAYGAVMLFSREVLDTVGPLDDRFYIYAEEMDYYMRVKRAGFHSFFISGIQLIHLGKSSSRQRRSAMFIQNYKSFYLFLRKHYGSFSYTIYRLRATLYLLLWYMKYSLQSDEESKTQKQVYSETLQWHFRKESF